MNETDKILIAELRHEATKNGTNDYHFLVPFDRYLGQIAIKRQVKRMKHEAQQQLAGTSEVKNG